MAKNMSDGSWGFRRAGGEGLQRSRDDTRTRPPGAHDFALVLDGLKPPYNIGKIFRSADAFGTREVHLVGIDFFDPAIVMWEYLRQHPLNTT